MWLSRETLRDSRGPALRSWVGCHCGWSSRDASICFRHLDSRGEQGGEWRGSVSSHCSAAVMNVSLAAVPDRIAAALCQRNLEPRSKRCATVSGYSYLTSQDRPGPGTLHVPYFSVALRIFFLLRLNIKHCAKYRVDYSLDGKQSCSIYQTCSRFLCCFHTSPSTGSLSRMLMSHVIYISISNLFIDERGIFLNSKVFLR